MFELHIRAEPFAQWLRRAAEMLQTDARQSLGQSVALALAHAKGSRAFKDQTGKLRGSITRFERGTWRMGIQATAKHAKFVEDDTKAHRIEAKKGNVLRFVQAGRVMFRRSVQHPGTKGTHFMQRAGELGGQALEDFLERAVKRSFR